MRADIQKRALPLLLDLDQRMSAWGQTEKNSLRANVFRVTPESGHCSMRSACLKRDSIWAEQSPFDLKDSLKRRGYRWSDGSDGRPRSWYVDVDESNPDDEIPFLQTEIYLRDVEPRLQTLTAFDRFSVRA
jgi:hypothetical protein